MNTEISPISNQSETFKQGDLLFRLKIIVKNELAFLEITYHNLNEEIMNVSIAGSFPINTANGMIDHNIKWNFIAKAGTVSSELAPVNIYSSVRNTIITIKIQCSVKYASRKGRNKFSGHGISVGQVGFTLWDWFSVLYAICGGVLINKDARVKLIVPDEYWHFHDDSTKCAC